MRILKKVGVFIFRNIKHTFGELGKNFEDFFDGHERGGAGGQVFHMRNWMGRVSAFLVHSVTWWKTDFKK